MPFLIEPIIIKEVKRPYDLEDSLHNEFKEMFVKSEWFKLSDNDTANCINIINKWQDQ